MALLTSIMMYSHRKAGIAGALLNIIQAGPDFDSNEEPPDVYDDDARSETDVRFRDQLTSVIWVLSVATSGNLLEVSGEQTPLFARSLLQVRHRPTKQRIHLVRSRLHLPAECSALLTDPLPKQLPTFGASSACRNWLLSRICLTWTTQSNSH